MYKFLQKHSKQILAVFSIGLMVAFALPGTRKQFAGNTDAVIGSIGDEKLHLLETREAKAEWDILRTTPAKNSRGYPIAFVLGPVGFDQISKHPEMFLLLQKEADRLGVGVTKDEVESFITNYVGDVPEDEEDDRSQLLRRAVRSMLLVNNAYQRAASVIKVSDPLRKHSMAQHTQAISLNLVEIRAADFAKNVPAPTTQQLQEQFDKFADLPPGGIDPQKNPFGFGYRYPNRVKLQYIGVSRPEVRKVVEASRDAQRWDVDARKYYLQHQDQFPATQPATTSPTTTAAATQPKIRSYEDAKTDVLAHIINPEVDRKLTAIQSRIVAALGTDWMPYRGAIAAGSTRPTTVPTSTMGVPYDSFDYLQKLAAIVQKEFGVLPTVASVADSFKTTADLKALPGIGGAMLDMTSFPDYAASAADAFVPADMKDAPNVLSLFEPSPVLKDDLQSFYFFRLTDASPSHRPEKMDEVIANVSSDARAAAEFAQAKSAAEAMLQAATKTSLSAVSGDRRVMTTGPFRFRPDAEVPGYLLAPDARAPFMIQAFEMLSSPATQPSGKRIKLIELPQTNKVIVAELNEVMPTANDSPAQLASYVAHQLAQSYDQDFKTNWFTWESVSNRLKYKPVEKNS